MFEQIKKAISKSGVGQMKEFVRLQKSMDSVEKSIESARKVVAKSMKDGQGSSKMKYIAEALNVNTNGNNTTSKKSVHINGDMTNKRPMSITFMGKTVEAKNWRAVSEAVLNMLWDKDKAVFANFIKDADQGKSPYIARKPEGMKAPVMLGSGRGAIYADVSRVTNNDFLFLKKVMSAAKVSENDLVINLDPTFYRKPVSRRKKETTKSKKPVNKKTVSKKVQSKNPPKRRGRPAKSSTASKATAKKSA